MSFRVYQLLSHTPTVNIATVGIIKVQTIHIWQAAFARLLNLPPYAIIRHYAIIQFDPFGCLLDVYGLYIYLAHESCHSCSVQEVN